MRVLIVTGVFGGPVSNPWLLDDLAAEFARGGDTVDVIVSDTKNPWPRGASTTPQGVTVFSAGPSRIRAGRIGKVLTIASGFFGLHLAGYRFARRNHYDLVVYTSIGVFSWGLPARIRARRIAERSIFVLWDFFPIHQYEIGRISRRFPERLLKSAEALTFRNADAIALMTPANERFFREYYSGSGAPVVIVPPWASDCGGVADSAKRERFTVIFGGQLAPGRGVDTLLHAAQLLQQEGVQTDILIVGDGPSRESLEQLAESLGLANTSIVGFLPRDAYRELLATTHVGVAITVSGVTPPTFPSKIAEYSAQGIPTIVCVEAASDAGEIVQAAGAGLSVSAGNARALADAISRLAQEHREGHLAERARKARWFYDAQLSVRRAVDRLRSIVGRQDPLIPQSMTSET